MTRTASVTTAEEPLTFVQCLIEAFNTPGLLADFSRLTGHTTTVAVPSSRLEAMIDEAVGFKPEADPKLARSMEAFALFVREFVWLRLPPTIRAEQCWVPSGTLELA
ncbi:hypothetical protein [Burkholderia cenocepacia]|uniref:hypothetical protein n=1 Tax=Burkholderia cenocepacia TaxID=95486 RepID=UPI000760DD17|nr:hypothetical protein [Burkholderia cenocepacia]KWU23364.1 hypothetical protein AS149_37470 [Burkholderia cenocepacia]